MRRYEDNFLYSRAFLFHVAGGGVVAGASNFSASGLSTTPGLSLGHYEDAVVGKVEGWFEDLWAAGVPFDLAELYGRLFDDYDPYIIYLAVLNHLYGSELQEEEKEEGLIPITSFQKHGVWRARRILQKYGGVLVADGVGLGKTFVAGEIMREYRDNRQRVLLVSPAALRDSTWDQFLWQYSLRDVVCVSYEQLARDRQLGGDGDYLKHPLADFALVVIDEAQNYRNPSAPARAGVLRELLNGPRRDLLLLSATPVNNSLFDLYHLLDTSSRTTPPWPISRSCRSADDSPRRSAWNPSNLNPDVLFPVIDATTVKRTRQFIKKYYGTEDITLADGRRVPIQFPKPVPSSITYDLDKVLPGFLDRLEKALMPPAQRFPS